MEKSTIKEDVNGYVRQLTITPPFDRRHPDPKKNYGIGGMTLHCLVIKDKKAVQFLAYLPVHLPEVTDELWNKHGTYNSFKGMGADVGYHSPTPMFDDQEPMKEKCPYIGCACYYDGSSLRADEWYKVFLREGLGRIWEMLEADWIERFS